MTDACCQMLKRETASTKKRNESALEKVSNRKKNVSEANGMNTGIIG